jgi:hypothetical protein
MFGSTILDVVIGLTFTYLLLSLIVSAINEFIEAHLKMRSVELYYGLRELLHDPKGTAMVKGIYNHPLIYPLFRGEFTPKQHAGESWQSFLHGSKLPSYIPSRNFALALMDLILPAEARTSAIAPTAPTFSSTFSLQPFRDAVAELSNETLRGALLPLIDTANGDAKQALANIEAWYNSAMERVSGWYKRYTQYMLFAIGLASAVILNIDTLAITHSLIHDKSRRDVILTAAQGDLANTNGPSTKGDVARYLEQLQSVTFPIGWQVCEPVGTPLDTCDPSRALSDTPGQWRTHLTHLPGWLLTAFAVTLGAPFWFDVLNKFMVIRSTVKPREKSQDEASEDRQRQGGAASESTTKDR